MFLFRKRQKERNNRLSIEEKQDLSTIEKETEVYIEKEYVDINKKNISKTNRSKKTNN